MINTTKCHWRRYNGARIESPGWMLSVESRAGSRFGSIDRVHAYVWQRADDRWGSYYERHDPGQVIDVELPVADTEREAKRVAKQALLNCIK